MPGSHLRQPGSVWRGQPPGWRSWARARIAGLWRPSSGGPFTGWGPKSTPRQLRLVSGLLLVAGGLVGVFGTVLAVGAAREVARVDTTTARAVIAAQELRACLTDADRAASHAFLASDVLLSGPGQRYRDAIAGAGRALEQLAEVLGAGGDGQALQAIDAELVTYSGLVEQADATFRAEAASGEVWSGKVGSGKVESGKVGSGKVGSEEVGSEEVGAGLGRAYLWYASKMLHEPGEGLLARVDRLVAGQEQTLRAEPWWLGDGPLQVFPVAAVAWIAGLVGAQVWLAGRFRRVLNPPLVLATVCAVLACGWAVAGLSHLQHGTHSAEVDALRPLLTLWQARSAVADADGQVALLGIEATQCPAGAACTTVLASLDESLASAVKGTSAAQRELSTTPQPLPDHDASAVLGAVEKAREAAHAGAVGQVVSQSRQAEPVFSNLDLALADRIQRLDASWTSRLTAAQAVPALRTGILAPAALAVALTAWGFGARLAEYRTGRRG
jgi:hypothetical protein